MKNNSAVLIVVAVLAAFAGSGVTLLMMPKNVAGMSEVSSSNKTVDVDTERALQTANGQIEMLRKQIAALEQARNKIESDNAMLRQTVADREVEIGRMRLQGGDSNSHNQRAGGGENNNRQRGNFEERMAQMQRDNPERAAEWQQQRDAFRQRMHKQIEERADFLNRVETANMSEEQRANHEELLLLSAEMRELHEKMPDMNREEMGQAWRKIAENGGRLATLYENERRYLLEATGEMLGFKGAESAQFADQIQMIYDQTSIIPSMGGRRGNMNAGRRDRNDDVRGNDRAVPANP